MFSNGLIHWGLFLGLLPHVSRALYFPQFYEPWSKHFSYSFPGPEKTACQDQTNTNILNASACLGGEIPRVSGKALQQLLERQSCLWKGTCGKNETAIREEFFKPPDGTIDLLLTDQTNCFANASNCTPEQVSQYEPIKSWMRGTNCRSKAHIYQTMKGPDLNGCCSYCKLRGGKADVFYWPDPDADTSCLSIVGEGIPVEYGATTDGRQTYWGCISTMTDGDTKTNRIASLSNITLNENPVKSYIEDVYDEKLMSALCPHGYDNTRAISTSLSARVSTHASQLTTLRSITIDPSTQWQNGTRVSTVIFENYTFTSLSIYVLFSSIEAVDSCGTSLIPSTMLTFAPGQLSTMDWTYTTTSDTIGGWTRHIISENTRPFNFKDMPCPHKSVATFHDWIPSPGDPYRPYIAIPNPIRNHNYWFGTCDLEFSAYDPPHTLDAANAMAQGVSAPAPGITLNPNVAKETRPKKPAHELLPGKTQPPKPSITPVPRQSHSFSGASTTPAEVRVNSIKDSRQSKGIPANDESHPLPNAHQQKEPSSRTVALRNQQASQYSPDHVKPSLNSPEQTPPDESAPKPTENVYPPQQNPSQINVPQNDPQQHSQPLKASPQNSPPNNSPPNEPSQNNESQDSPRQSKYPQKNPPQNRPPQNDASQPVPSVVTPDEPGHTQPANPKQQSSPPQTSPKDKESRPQKQEQPQSADPPNAPTQEATKTVNNDNAFDFVSPIVPYNRPETPSIMPSKFEQPPESSSFQRFLTQIQSPSQHQYQAVSNVPNLLPESLGQNSLGIASSESSFPHFNIQTPAPVAQPSAPAASLGSVPHETTLSNGVVVSRLPSDAIVVAGATQMPGDSALAVAVTESIIESQSTANQGNTVDGISSLEALLPSGYEAGTKKMSFETLSTVSKVSQSASLSETWNNGGTASQDQAITGLGNDSTAFVSLSVSSIQTSLDVVSSALTPNSGTVESLGTSAIATSVQGSQSPSTVTSRSKAHSPKYASKLHWPIALTSIISFVLIVTI